MIKVGMLPGKIEEFVFEDGTTVAQALELAGLNADGYEVRVDSNVKELSYVLTDTDRVVLLVKKIKGNSDTDDMPFTVKIGMLPGKIEEFGVNAGTTVAQALDLANLDPTDYEVRVDSNVKSLDYTLANTDRVVLLVKKIKGN